LKEDPQEVLLTQILQALRGNSNSSSPSPFRPTAAALAINTLWFISLTLTLMSALAGVLAKGWLAQYNPVSRKERMEDAYKRQHRSNMAEIWGLGTAISLIPFGIQMSLFLFFAGLIIQLQSDDLGVRLVILLLVIIAAILYLWWTVSPLFITEFPFSTPLSRYLGAWTWLKRREWDMSGLLERFGLTKETVLRALGQYDTMELQLQVLTWGVTSTDEETTDEAIKALSGVKQSARLREKLYDQEIHKMIFERLQQKLQLSDKSSLLINNTPQLETILLALLRIEQPLNLDHQIDQAIWIPSNMAMTLPDWEQFRPCLQQLAFSLRIHMLVNRKSDDGDEIWLQRVEALDRMVQNPSSYYVRKVLLFTTLRGLLRGEEYTRRECGIVFSQLLMIREDRLIQEFIHADGSLVGTRDELVGIMEALVNDAPNEHGLAGCRELSKKIIDLVSCEDEASRRAGARIMILLMLHGQSSASWMN
jgi:hypothetical protein